MKKTALAALALLAAAPLGMTRGPDGDDVGTRLAGPPSGPQTRYAPFQPSTYDAEARTVELILSVGAAVNRRWFVEELEISSEAVDVGRVGRGLVPLLDSHNRWGVGAVLGQVVSTRFETISGVVNLIAMARFADTDAGRAAEGMVARGELRGVSIGYDPKKWECTHIDTETEIRTWRATSWELLEASLVPVPADPAAGVRSAPSAPGSNGARATPQEDDDMIRSRLMGGAAAGAYANAVRAPDTDAGAAPAPVAQPEARAATPAQVPSAAAEPAPPVGEAARAAPNSAAAPPAGQVSRFSAVDALSFNADAAAFGLAERAVELVGQNERGEISVETARAQLLREAGERQRAATGARQPSGAAAGGARSQITRDERDTRRDAMAIALRHRFDPGAVELTEPAREFRGMSLLELARDNLERNGERVRGMSRMELADVALRQHSTSDFPNVLGNVARATLRRGYEEDGQTFKRWQRRTTAPDFRAITRVQMGSAPGFLLVPEGGEFKYGSIGDGKESYALATYGRRFAVTRQTLVNDDLDAFTRIPQLFGAAAARFESDVAYAPLISNPNMADGNALFSSAHGNLAGSGAAPSEASVNAAEIAMGKQTGLGGEILNVSPKFLLTARKDRLGASKLLTAVQSTQTSEVNVYANAFELIVESRLNRTAGATPWFMAADPNQIDTIEYAYLEGEEGVFLDERTGFEVDGMEFKARLDFASKAIDWRGLYMDPGA